MAPAPTHDLVVIGAGPAGASAARMGRALGLSVALVDRAAFPRDKLCGGALTGRCQGELAAVHGAVSPDLFVQSRHVRLTDGLRVLADIPDAPPLWFTRRRQFDAALRAGALAAGADDFSGQKVVSVDAAGASVTLEGGTLLRGRVLVGADGVSSAVARALFGRPHDPMRVGLAMEVEVPAVPGAALVAELDMTAARWGYGWSFPTPGGVLLGLGGVSGRNPAMKADFAGWLAARGHDPGSLGIKGHHLPFGDPRPAPARGAVLLAGDAAGLVDPLTGEGIGWAIASGRMAAEAAAEVRAGGDASATYLRRIAPVRAEIGRARWLAGLIYHPRLQPRVLRMLAASPHLQRRYLSLMAGEMDYADIGPARMARLGWRVLTGARA